MSSGMWLTDIRWRIAILICFLFAATAAALGLMNAAPAVLIATALTYCMALSTSTRSWTSPAPVFMAMFALFSVGLVLASFLGQQPSAQTLETSRYFDETGVTGASAIISLGFASIAAGMFIASLVVKAADSDVREADHGSGLQIVGITAYVVGLFGWVIALLSSGGIGLVFSGYDVWLARTSTLSAFSLPTAYLLLGLGLPMVIASESLRLRRFAYVTYTLWAIPALAIGLRGEVLLPLCAALVVHARQKPVQWRWRYLVIAVAGLGLGSVIRAGRGSSDDWSLTSFNPIDGLVEMGGSIRPIVEVWTWHFSGAEPFVGWRTYWAPIQRPFWRFLGLPFLPADQDPNVFNITILQRVGPIGGNPLAEAYHSAGLVGVALVALALGLCLVFLDRLRTTPLMNAFVGGVTWILLLWSRNDFTPVPAQIVYLTALLGLAVVLTTLARPRHRPAHLRRQVPRSSRAYARTFPSHLAKPGGMGGG